MNKNNEFTCDGCGQKFISEWSDDEANEEAKDYWGVDNASQNKNMAVVCDDCFKKITTNVN